MKIMGCEVIERHILKGMDIAIKQGDKLYVWPNFTMPKELKYLEVPTSDELLENCSPADQWQKEIISAHRLPLSFFR